MPRGPETPIPIRAGILALHLFTDMNWVDISTKFLVHPDTAKKICQRAKERATDDSVNALFAALGDAERTGRPRKHSEGMPSPTPVQMHSIQDVPNGILHNEQHKLSV
jgi:hypothetical protein